MKSYISLLRGINVSGQKKILMADLKLLYEQLQFEQLKTYIQSGNVLFKCADKHDEEKIILKINKAIFKQYAFDVAILLRDQLALAEILKNNPYLNRKGILEDRLYVTLLSEEPDKKLLEKLLEIPLKTDEFQVNGKEIYLYCPGGYGETKLNNNFFESKLKLKASTRNWKTINTLSEMLSEY